MKKIILSIVFIVTGSFAFAHVGEQKENKDHIKIATDFVINAETNMHQFDNVRILDIYRQGSIYYVSFAPSYGGRKARNYHCWVLEITAGYFYSYVSRSERVYGRTCRPIEVDRY